MPWSRTFSRIALAGLVCFFIWAGSLGLDFGPQWDENYFFDGIESSIDVLAARPGSYTYNGNYFNVGYLALLPELLEHLPDVLGAMAEHPSRPMDPQLYPEVASMQEALWSELFSDAFTIRARWLFMLLASLGVVWTYLLARQLGENRERIGLAAAALYALCWEIGYHSRLIAVDGLLCQLAVLMFALLVIALGARTPRAAIYAYLGAALAAGAAIGCKLTAVFLLVPLAATPFIPSKLRERISRVDRLAMAAFALALAAFALITTTPGVIEDPLRFAMSVFYERFSYNKDTVAYTYAVGSLFEHFYLVLGYFATAVASWWAPLAIAATLLAIAGFIKLRRTRPDVTDLFLTFAVPYVLFVCSNILMITRNYLQLMPLFFALIAVGWDWMLEAPLRKFTRPAAIVLAAGLVGYNAYWNIWAGYSIQTTTRESILADAWSYLESRESALVSPRVREVFADRLDCREPPENLSRSIDVMLFFGEHKAGEWRGNRRFFYRRVFSSWEVNWEYSPTFPGRHMDHRLYAFSRRKALWIRVPMESFSLCTPRGRRA